MTDTSAERGRLDRWPAWIVPLLVGAVAAAVRAWVLWDQRGANPLFQTAILDDRTYLELAQATLDGSGSQGGWFLAPLHPWVLAQVGRFAGVSMLTASVLGLVCGALASAITAVTGRVLHSNAAGLAAGLLHALAGTLVFHDVLPGQEPLLSLLHAACVLLAVLWLRSGNVWAAAGTGALAGVAALGRSVSLSLAIAALVVGWWQLRPRKTFAMGALTLVGGLLLALVPAGAQNNSAVGNPSPFPWSAGPNLYMANGPEARKTVMFGAAELGMAPEAMRARAREIAEDAEHRALGPYEVSSYWSGRTWDERGSIGALLGHGAKKAALFWGVREVGNNHFAGLERRFSTYLTVIPVSAWWLLALGVGGYWLARDRAPLLDVAAVTILVTWAGLTIVYPVSRYRVPVLPLCALLAGVGIAVAWRREARRRELQTALIVVAAVSGLAWSDLALRPQPNASASYQNVAHAMWMGDRPHEARDVLLEATETYPEDGTLRVLLGRSLLDLHRPHLALTEFQTAETDERVRFTAAAAAIRGLVEIGDLDKAEELASALARDVPDDPATRAELLANWALAARARENYVVYSQRLGEAEALMPDHPAVIHARGSD